MKFVTVALMVIFALVSQALAASFAVDEHRCAGENEAWNDCGNHCAVRTCDEELRHAPYRPCARICQPGCYCAGGFMPVGHNTRGINERTCMPVAMCH